MYFTSSHTSPTTREAYLLPSLFELCADGEGTEWLYKTTAAAVQHTLSNDTAHIWQSRKDVSQNASHRGRVTCIARFPEQQTKSGRQHAQQ